MTGVQTCALPIYKFSLTKVRDLQAADAESALAFIEEMKASAQQETPADAGKK